MLIQCPACHARAKLPDSKEGAKVRCGECGRVFVALPPGARGRARSSSGNQGLMIGIAVAVVALLVIVFVSRSGDSGKDETVAAATAEEEEPEPEEILGVGWEAPSVQGAARIHELAYERNATQLAGLLYGPGIHARSVFVTAAEEGDGDTPAMPDLDDPTMDTAAREFLRLPAYQQEELVAAVAKELVSGTGKELIADWRPYDGEIVSTADDAATVRIAVTPRDSTSAEKRWIEWRLVRQDMRWKAWSWERWFSPEELAAQKRKRQKGYDKVVLSDGSVVLEREPEPLEHLEGTSPELRTKIDVAYGMMIDLDLTTEGAAAKRELVAIGRPSIPILLTGLYEIPLDTEDNAIRCNMIVQALREITGQYMGYKPQVMEGSGTGTTEERRQSAIKQWFAWWYRNQDKFVEKETDDALEGLIELTEKEKRWLERNKD